MIDNHLDQPVLECHTDLHVAAVHIHASDHAALSCHICPVDHLLCIVEVQRHCIIQTLKHRRIQEINTGLTMAIKILNASYFNFTVNLTILYIL